ncbi:hypothetical protein Tco_0962556, partial [Tanacetum coccineum]
MYSCEFCFGIDAVMALFYTKEGRRKANCGKEQAAKDQYWKIHICYDDDEDYTIAITPILSTKEPVNSLSMGDEHLDTIPITPSSDFVIKSLSTFPNSFLEETNTFDNSIPESETFCFDLEENSSGSTTTSSDYSLPDYEAFYDNHIEEKSSGSTTTHSDYSLPDYEAFYDNHIEEKSSGSTTTHADFSKYDSFIFDLSINPFPPADRSDFYHEEFADELAHIISPPKYDCFCFKNKPELGDFIIDVVDDIFPTREPRVHVPNVL